MESGTPKDQTIIELIEAVIKRPAMYVGECRFHTAICYLEGFSLGLHLGKAEHEAGLAEIPDEWSDFTTWLWKKLCPPTGLGPFSVLRSACPDDETAFVELVFYWSEYQASKQKKPRQMKPRRGGAVGG
jgi:hypothetical protein